MRKSTAHFLMGCFDVVAVAACWWAWSDWQQLNSAISTGGQPIVIQRPVGLVAIGAMVPVLHLTSLFEWPPRRARWANLSILGMLFFVAFAAFGADWLAETRLTAGGYSICPNGREVMTRSTFETWAREEAACAR